MPDTPVPHAASPSTDTVSDAVSPVPTVHVGPGVADTLVV